MKKNLLLLLIFLLAGSTLSMTDDFYSSLLNESDYQMQLRDVTTRGPALSAPLDGKNPYWASYNQWLCLPAEAIEITCLEADYNGIVKVPALHVTHDAHYYEISMEPDPKPDCEFITRRWRELLDGESIFCAYAAPLQEYDAVPPSSGAKDGSVWIINRLKSGKGGWDFEADENWLKDDEDIPADRTDEEQPPREGDGGEG